MFKPRRNKSLFASFSSEKEDSVLFLKKKNQKDFYSLCCVALVFCSPTAAQAADAFLIVPGEQVGLVRLPAKEADFIKAYKNEARPAEIGEGEGGIERVTVLFPCSADKIAVLHYDKSTRLAASIEAPPAFETVLACAFKLRKDPYPDHRDPLMKGQEPGDTNAIGYYGANQTDAGRQSWWQKAAALTPSGYVSLWHLANGIHAGMTLAELGKMNGQPFTLRGPEGDGPGHVTDWHGGALANCTWAILPEFPKADSGKGETYDSSDSRLHADSMHVLSLTVGLTSDAACKPGKQP